MIRRLVASALCAGGFLVTACGTSAEVELPNGGGTVGVTVPSDLTSVSAPSLPDGSDAFGAQLENYGFVPNADKSEYTKKDPAGDITIIMGPDGPTNIRYNNELLNCNPTIGSVLTGAATGVMGGSNHDVARLFCGVS